MMADFPRRLGLARDVFILALVAAVVSLFMPWTGADITYSGSPFTSHLVSEIQFKAVIKKVLIAWPPTFMSLIELTMGLFLAMALGAAPFLPSFLAKARPLLWSARLLAVLIVGVAVESALPDRRTFTIASTIASGPIVTSHEVHLAGYWVFRASLVLLAFGFFVIPKPEEWKGSVG